MPNISPANLDLNISLEYKLNNAGIGNDKCQTSQLTKPKIDMLKFTIDNLSAKHLAMQDST